MRTIFKFLIPGLLIAVFASAATATKPDLLVSKASLTRDKSGLFVEKITVTITNGRRDVAGASYVLVTFKENEHENVKSIYYVGNAVRALKGGESQTQTFDVLHKKIVFGRHVLIEVDPYKKVAEVSEGNNWRTLFPDGGGVTISQMQCVK